MDDITKILTIVFGGIITLAIVSVVIGQKSQAPAAISAVSGGISSIVSAAVSPVSTASTNGNNGSNIFTTLAGTGSSLLGSGSTIGSLLGVAGF